MDNTLADGVSGVFAVESVYMTKNYLDGTVGAFNRGYRFLGFLSGEQLHELRRIKYVVDTWGDYTGGDDGRVGLARWWSF